MPDMTRLLEAVQSGDRHAADQLLPLVYDELRNLAAAKMNAESPGHTLDATALVHEAYLRLIGDQHFECRGHFFAAAAEAMRRILVEAARKKGRIKHGGERRRVELIDVPVLANPDDLLDLNDALDKLAALDGRKAHLVTLRYFGGLTMPEAARSLNISLATAERWWTFTKAWLYSELNGAE